MAGGVTKSNLFCKFLTKNKKDFSDKEVLKGAMMIIAKTVFKDEKNVPMSCHVMECKCDTDSPKF